MSALLEGALDLARRGLRVFPLHTAVALGDGRFVCACGRLKCNSPAKHPLPRLAPNGLRSASLSEAEVRHWRDVVPQANVGLVTGDVIVLDVDPRHGGDCSLEALERQHGELPADLARADRRGRPPHLTFSPPAVDIPNSVGVLAPGLDVRGDGGYVVAPPSVHISGRIYAWSVDHHPDEVPLAPMPEWLVRALTTPASAGSAQSPSAWREIVRDGVAEGSRNKTIAKLAGHLLRRYVDPLGTLELMLALNAARFTPPLSREEVTNTVGSIARKERLRREACDASR